MPGISLINAFYNLLRRGVKANCNVDAVDLKCQAIREAEREGDVIWTREALKVYGYKERGPGPRGKRR